MDVLLQTSLALFAASLTGWFAVQKFYQQREYELILSRYLEGGLDLLAAEVERVNAAFHHNWARCLSVLVAYRDLEDDFDLVEFEKGFVELQSSNLNIVAHHRLFTLVGTHEYWSVYQSAMAFFTNANTVLVKQIPDAIRIKLTTTKIEYPHAEVVEEGFKEAKLQQERSQRYVQLVAELQVLSAALESEKFRFSELINFQNKKEVKASIIRLKNLFTEDLSKYAAYAQPCNAPNLAQEAAQGQ